MYEINTEVPKIMHIDLNSAFATAEQQAHPSLRGRPMGVTNRVSKHCCVIAASYEAKALGVKVGMRLDEVLQFIPDFIMLETDPPKYHHMYQKIASIMKSYSPKVKMKSIDEGVIDFTGTTEHINQRPLEDIGYEIKRRVKTEMGSWMKVNVGIGTNQFLAKQAAGWHKPDGLDVLDHHNLLDYYKSIELTDLSGIATHFQARLNAAGIFTPMEFLMASSDTLRRLVFHSIIGNDWYGRLRGIEVDDVQTKLGVVGRQWVLGKSTSDDSYILPCFQYLCETVGKKLRFNGVDARGVLVWAQLRDGDSWYERKMFKTTFFTDQEIYRRALYLMNRRPKGVDVVTMGITCYKLTPSNRSQMSLFDKVNKEAELTYVIDGLNERYGNFVIGAAHSMLGKELVKQKIPFGGTKYFELLLKRA